MDTKSEGETHHACFRHCATGFVSAATVPELLNTGYQVLDLARSNEGAKSLIATGAELHRGDLEDLESLHSGAAMSDGVIHAAFNHDDFSKFAENCETDQRAIEVIDDVLEGSDRPLIVTSGLLLTPDRLTTEDDVPPSGLSGTPRVSVVRMPQVHDRDKQGLATYMIALAREKGISAYVGTGLNLRAENRRILAYSTIFV